MAIVRMTLDEIKNYKLTPKQRLREWVASRREPDLSDPEHPEMTAEMFLKATRPGRKNPAMKKIQQNIRFDPDVLAGLKKTGPNWTTRVNDVMRQYLFKLGMI